ncbi:hypothetical protein O3P69_003356 [Scylla paramamosain]|uniref:Uncharacterized protein n=1 Tax=Scylla paramamosain TaxID=85552 RepID=A0AAW0UJM4_SCYPA
MEPAAFTASQARPASRNPQHTAPRPALLLGPPQGPPATVFLALLPDLRSLAAWEMVVVVVLLWCRSVLLRREEAAVHGELLQSTHWDTSLPQHLTTAAHVAQPTHIHACCCFTLASAFTLLLVVLAVGGWTGQARVTSSTTQQITHRKRQTRQPANTSDYIFISPLFCFSDPIASHSLSSGTASGVLSLLQRPPGFHSLPLTAGPRAAPTTLGTKKRSPLTLRRPTPDPYNGTKWTELRSFRLVVVRVAG